MGDVVSIDFYAALPQIAVPDHKTLADLLFPAWHEVGCSEAGRRRIRDVIRFSTRSPRDQVYDNQQPQTTTNDSEPHRSNQSKETIKTKGKQKGEKCPNYRALSQLFGASLSQLFLLSISFLFPSCKKRGEKMKEKKIFIKWEKKKPPKKKKKKKKKKS